MKPKRMMILQILKCFFPQIVDRKEVKKRKRKNIFVDRPIEAGVLYKDFINY